uniref:Uncharacterized protein n=1 Tax=Plectus sambesii TaxID=2011161 RepID=A0A914UP26_9BILA
MPPKKEWKLVLLTPSEDHLKKEMKQKGVHQRHMKKRAQEWRQSRMYLFAANVEGASFELYDCGSHVCQLEYRHGLKHEQQTALDLAMKLHSGTGTSTFVCHLLKGSNDEVTEKKKLRNTLSVLCKTQEDQPSCTLDR